MAEFRTPEQIMRSDAHGKALHMLDIEVAAGRKGKLTWDEYIKCVNLFYEDISLNRAVATVTVEVESEERKAVPQIPPARARSILKLAQDVSHAKVTGTVPKMKVTLSATLKGKLAAVGVDTGKIKDLNVDQAEDVEEFLKGEK